MRIFSNNSDREKEEGSFNDANYTPEKIKGIHNYLAYV
jgi:hypothetical protein